jgi:hypothetical protein
VVNRPTLYDHAVEWVANHRVVCTDKRCDCKTSEDDDMIDGLIARWLEDET